MYEIKLSEIETPALVLELDAFERNLRRMANLARKSQVNLRPHAKAHKCPAIANMQIAHGAIGVCCQTVSEAEAMANAGVVDVLLTNQVIDEAKLRRLAGLARKARISVCIDCEEHLVAASQAALDANATFNVLVEINVGHDRCGIQPGHAVVPLVEHAVSLGGVHFAGLQAYHGSAQHMRSASERAAAISRTIEAVKLTKSILADRGYACEWITGAGTGTCRIEASSGIYTEIQPGSYAFMDLDYAKNLKKDGRPVNDFEHSLFIRTTVISRAVVGFAVLDAGLKTVSVDSGYPQVAGRSDLEIVGLSDEHTKVRVPQHAEPLRVGDKISLIPGHVDPTVNLHSYFFGVRRGRVENVLPIVARGSGQLENWWRARRLS